MSKRKGRSEPLSDAWLEAFRKASQIVCTQRDGQGNHWIGEHAHLLIAEIDRLRRKLKA